MTLFASSINNSKLLQQGSDLTNTEMLALGMPLFPAFVQPLLLIYSLNIFFNAASY